MSTSPALSSVPASAGVSSARKFPAAFVSIARKEIGVEEHPRGSNRGPRIDEYQAATWLEEKDWDAWCAAFVDWCFRETLKATGIPETKTFKRPQTAGAYDLENWSRKQDNSTSTKDKPGADIQPGDICTLAGHSHVFIAETAPDKTGYFSTIEGNSNNDGSREGYVVVRHRRHYSAVKCRIRVNL